MSTKVKPSSCLTLLPLVALCLVSAVAAGPHMVEAAVDPLGQGGCPSGTVVGGPNLVTNGDFSAGSTGFTSELQNRGDGVYPDDFGGGGYSIQTGPVSYFNNGVVGRPFPGDQQREIPPVATYFYSNPRWTDAQMARGYVALWRQQVQGLTGNTTYNFFAYFDNLLVPTGFGVDPVIELTVDGQAAGPAVTVPKDPDRWVPVQFSFITAPNQTTATLEIRDRAMSTSGDDFGMTQISLKQCVTSLGTAKFAFAPVPNQDGTFTVRYLITVQNLGSDPEPLRDVQVIDNLNQTFAGAGSFTVVSVSSDALTVNPAYNGGSNINLLMGNDTLAAGQRRRINLEVRVTPGGGVGGMGPFANRAVTIARAGAITVSDSSVPGEMPDTDGDQDAGSDREERPTVIDLGVSPVFLPLVTR